MPDHATILARPAGSLPDTLPEIPVEIVATPPRATPPLRNLLATMARSTPFADPTPRSGPVLASSTTATLASIPASSFQTSSASARRFLPFPIPAPPRTLPPRDTTVFSPKICPPLLLPTPAPFVVQPAPPPHRLQSQILFLPAVALSLH